jgi:hypothetical protein
VSKDGSDPAEPKPNPNPNFHSLLLPTPTPQHNTSEEITKMPWPRIQFHELGDQTWLPSWLHHHEQFSLTQLWNLRVPFWSCGSLATQACAVLESHLTNPSDYTIVDICAGAGGPTPFIEKTLNSKAEKEGRDAVRFVLTDMFPPVDQWAAISKKQPNISFVSEAVDARAVKRLDESVVPGKKECRIFNICFHHFVDDDAMGILRSAVEEADAFVYVSFGSCVDGNANDAEYSKSPREIYRHVCTRRSCSSGDST